MEVNKTVNMKFLELCEEIDYWKERADYYKEKYEEELNQRAIESKERLLEAQRGVANALMLSLSVRDDADGNLVINKEDREKLAKSFKTNENDEQ